MARDVRAGLVGFCVVVMGAIGYAGQAKPPAGGESGKRAARAEADRSQAEGKAAGEHFKAEPTEVPAAFDRDVENNSAGW